MPAAPYLAGTNTPGTATSQTIAISQATSAGDAVLVALGESGLAATVNSVSDSQGNTYARVGSANVSSQFSDVFLSTTGTALSTSDTITVSWSSISGTKNCVAVGIPGLTASPTDQDVKSASASSATPSTTSSTLAQANEVAIGICQDANTGGAPGSLGSFTQIAQLHGTGTEWTTIAYLNTPNTSAVTWSVSITGTTSCVTLITFKLAATLASLLLIV